MADTNTARIIDLETDQSEAQSRLQFQDFTGTAADTHAPQPTYTSFPVGGMNDDDDAESDELLSREKKKPSFWEFSYYQSLFDVTTTDVLKRLLWSTIPVVRGPSYLDKRVRPNPDLYGPVWVGITLIVTTSVSSNIAEYLETIGRSKEFWHTDYTRVSFAASAILLYIFILPLLIWTVLKYRNIESRYSLLESVCLYGYSLSVFIPISILLAIRLQWLRWLLTIIGTALSGTVLVSTFWPSFRDETRKVALLLIGVIFTLHILIALGFVEYFFKAHSGGEDTIVTTTIPTVSNSTASSLLLQVTSQAATVAKHLVTLSNGTISHITNSTI